MEEQESPSSSSGSQVAFLPRRPKRSPGPSPLGREIGPRQQEQEQQTFYFSEHQQQMQEPQQQQQQQQLRTSSVSSAAVRELSSGNGSSSSRVSPLDSAGNKLERWATLVWRDLTVTMDGRNKVVQSLTGYATPGTLTALMGSSSSGKINLLRALAGRLPGRAKVYGEVLVNGRPRYLKYGTYAYVNQGDELLETLTVRETLYYAALLQLPVCLPCSEKTAMVDAVISDMELEDVAAVRVGGCFIVRGLSAGERRRLTIAIELLTRPALIFCEEPIRDLDSASAFLLIASLKKLTAAGSTVLITTERMCTEVFHLVTTICLLSKGKTVFFGDTIACLEHFATAGFPCPSLQNPTDHFLRALNPEFQKVNRITKVNQDYEQGDSPWRRLDASVITRTLETTYSASNDAAAVEAVVSHLAEKEGPMLKSRGHAPLTTRLVAVACRSFLNMFRSWTYYWLRLLLSMLLMFCIGTIFYNLGDTSQLIRVRVSAIFCMLSFLSLLSIAGLPALAKDMKVYMREKENDHSSALVFVLGNAMSSTPYLFLISAVCSSIGYFFMGFQAAFGFFVYFLITLFICMVITEGLLLVTTAITLDTFTGMLVVTSIEVLMMLVCGYFRQLSDLPKPVWKYPASYVAFQTYAIEGLLENEYTAIRTRSTLRKSYSSWNSAPGKWLDLCILMGMAVAYRILLYLVLLGSQRSRNNGYCT